MPDPSHNSAHMIPMVKTAYGWRAVCRKHSRVWTWIKGEAAEVEETYQEGMVHHGS